MTKKRKRIKATRVRTIKAWAGFFGSGTGSLWAITEIKSTAEYWKVMHDHIKVRPVTITYSENVEL